MLALIAGTGDLPVALAARLDRPFLVCALDGFEPALSVDISLRIEHLGSFLEVLKDHGVNEICMAGAIRRPQVDPAEIDPATRPLVPRIQAALAAGDDGALRVIIAIFEENGFAVRAAHDIAPDLLAQTGFLTRQRPRPRHRVDAARGEAAIADMGAQDTGQACVIRAGQVLAREDADGTDAMLKRLQRDGLGGVGPDLFGVISGTVTDAIDGVAEWLSGPEATPINDDGAILFKAPKPDQDRRADLPVIGPQTVSNAAALGLAGIVIEAGGVLVLNREAVIAALEAHDMFLWVRPRGGA